ncbi:MAG: hypothetical protein KDD41_09955 [Flavobacteriales bacterium]|nr:hypothetical protein [Flavobacteriales bacterium]
MKFEITPNSVDYAAIQEKLKAKFPDYEFNMRGKQYLVCKKTGSVGANIVIRKSKVMVVGNFPTMGGQMLFILSVVLLGFLIPLIVYFAAFHTKMKALEKEVGAYLQEEYGVKA